VPAEVGFVVIDSLRELKSVMVVVPEEDATAGDGDVI
jgi:hypothetical protein